MNKVSQSWDPSRLEGLLWSESMATESTTLIWHNTLPGIDLGVEGNWLKFCVYEEYNKLETLAHKEGRAISNCSLRGNLEWKCLFYGEGEIYV